MTREISKNVLDQLYAERWGLLVDDVGQAVTRAFQFGCAQDFDHRLLEYRVREHKIEMERCPFSSPEELSEGDFVIGRSIKGSPIRCPAEYMGSPGLIVASTGGGKTTAARFWAIQLAVLFLGAWLIDCRKREMRIVASMLARTGLEVLVVSANQLKINPLQVPKNVSPHSFAASAADTLVRVLRVAAGAKKILHQCVHHLYEKHGVFDGNVENYPVMMELRDFVAQASQFHSQARDALISALDPLLMSLRKVLAYRRGYGTEDLRKRRIVFEFDACSEAGKDLLTNALLLSEFQSRVASGFSNVKPDLFIYLDEGSSLLESDDSAIAQWVGLLRGIGMAILFSNQSAVSISQRVLSNVPNRFLGQCSSFADLNAMASAIGLDVQQKRYLATHLRPGLLLGSLGQGTSRHPFLFTTPLIQTSETDAVCEPGSSGLESLPVNQATEYLDWQPEWARTEIINPVKTTTTMEPGNEVAGTAKMPELDRSAQRLLEAVVANPCKPASFFPPEVQMGKQTVIRLRKLLIKEGLISEQQTQLAARGRPSILLVPTERGLDVASTSTRETRRPQ